jgi:hypothetical protein
VGRFVFGRFVGVTIYRRARFLQPETAFIVFRE